MNKHSSSFSYYLSGLSVSVVNRYLFSLCVLLTFKSILIFWFILHGGVGLGPDEAQYWTWSKALDWGYYSKPPGIAWQIWMGTQIFGDTEIGVRFFSIVIAFLLSLAVFWLALACRLRAYTAFWAGVVMALCPMGIMGSFLAITDGGMLLFWTLACVAITSCLSNERTPNYYLVGLLIGCGALFKWSSYILWPVIIFFIPFLQSLASLHILGGIFVSLIGLVPSVAWNASHQWVTFRHVIASLTGTKESTPGPQGVFHGNFLEFVGSQIILLSPILFFLMILGFVYLFKNRKKISAPISFRGASCLLILSIIALMSIFQKAQGNWADFAYPTGIVFLSWYSCEAWEKGKKWLQAGVALSIVLSVLALSIPYVQSNNLVPIPYKLSPFRHNVGWSHLADGLNEAGYDPHNHFLFGDKYQTSSILSFYGPEQKRAYFLNLQGVRLNQFSFWPSMVDDQLHQTGYFVAVENSPHLEKNSDKQIDFYQKALLPYCQEVQFFGVHPLYYSNGVMVKGAMIFKCIDYNGKIPKDSNLF